MCGTRHLSLDNLLPLMVSLGASGECASDRVDQRASGADSSEVGAVDGLGLASDFQEEREHEAARVVRGGVLLK